MENKNQNSNLKDQKIQQQFSRKHQSSSPEKNKLSINIQNQKLKKKGSNKYITSKKKIGKNDHSSDLEKELKQSLNQKDSVNEVKKQKQKKSSDIDSQGSDLDNKNGHRSHKSLSKDKKIKLQKQKTRNIQLLKQKSGNLSQLASPKSAHVPEKSFFGTTIFQGQNKITGGNSPNKEMYSSDGLLETRQKSKSKVQSSGFGKNAENQQQQQQQIQNNYNTIEQQYQQVKVVKYSSNNNNNNQQQNFFHNQQYILTQKLREQQRIEDSIKQQKKTLKLQQSLIYKPLINIEVCHKCLEHQDSHPQYKHDVFELMYLKVEKCILQYLPSANIQKNIEITNPRIGAFEIKHGNNLIWSKLQFGDFPSTKHIGARVYNYYNDLQKGRDIQRYQLVSTLNNSYIQKSIKNSPQYQPFNKNDPELLREYLNQNVNDKEQNASPFKNQKNNNNISIQNKFKNNDFIQQQIFGNTTLPNPDEIVTQFQSKREQQIVRVVELEQDYFDQGDIQQLNDEQEQLQQLKRGQGLHHSQSENINTVNFRSNEGKLTTKFLQNIQLGHEYNFNNQEKFLSKEDKIELKIDINSTQNNFNFINNYNNTNNNNQQDNNQQDQQKTNINNNNNQQNITNITSQNSQGQIQESNEQGGQNQNVFQKQIETQQILGELNIKDQKNIKLILDIRKSIDNFWINFRPHYLSFYFNPSFKRLSWELYEILVYIKQQIQMFKHEYEFKAHYLNQTMKSEQTQLIKYQQTQKTLQDLKESSNNTIEDQKNIIAGLHKELEQTKKEFEEYRRTTEKTFQQQEVQYLKEIQSLEQDLNQKRKSFIELKQQEEQTKQELHKRQSIIEDQGKKTMVNKMQYINLQIQLDNQKTKIEEQQSLIKRLKERENELQEQMVQSNQLLKNEIQEYRDEIKQYQEEIKQSKDLRDDIEITQQNKIEELESQIKSFKEKSSDKEKHLHDTLIKVEKQMETYKFSLSKLALLDYKTIYETSSILRVGMFVQGAKVLKDKFEMQCIIVNELGDIDDTINDINTTSNGGAIYHSGKRKSMTFDQEILINFNKITSEVKMLCIFVYPQANTNLSQLVQGKIHSIQDQLITNTVTIRDCEGRYFLAYFLVKQTNRSGWKYIACKKFGRETNMQKVIVDNMKITGFQINPNVAEVLRWNPQSGKVFTIKTNELIPIPVLAYKKFVIGLGWETKQDLDSSVILLDKEGFVVDNVYFENLKSKDGAVQHNGDMQDGDNEGDDETITIDLTKLDESVAQLWVFICVYTKGKSFNEIEDTYCRFLCGDIEFCRYDLSSIKDSNIDGCLMCDLYKMGNKWTIKGRGYFTQNTSTSEQVIPIIKEIHQNNFDNVKILEPSGELTDN